MTGIINLDKPAGISSARAVGQVKRLLPRGTKIGHAGTLDPFATGVLLLLIGKATKSCEMLMSCAKEYVTAIQFGATTATDDPTSPEILPAIAANPISADAIEQALKGFVGTIVQRPPVFSAMKIGGRRAYQLARSGIEVEMKPRPVRIDSIEILDYDWPVLNLKIACGRGTYIRSIARDLGEHLGVGGYLTALRRTRIGSFAIADSTTIEQLSADGVDKYLYPSSFIPATDAAAIHTDKK